MNFLTVAAIFKNEAHVMKEWVQHYINEGADHFLLIDNGSTDEYRREIQEFMDQGLITIIHDDSRWAQVELYNKYFHDLKGQTNWLLVCDLDEFVYARRGYSTIAIFLRDLSEKVGVVRIPWKMFGSSGHVKQPEQLITGFQKRAKQERNQRPWMPDEKRTQSKVIVRPEKVTKYFVHQCETLKECQVIGANRKKMKYKRVHSENHFQPVSERILRNSYLHLNHYALQSKDWFLNVKCKRGAADTENHENIRNQDYFEKYDSTCNDIIDDELVKKTY